MHSVPFLLIWHLRQIPCQQDTPDWRQQPWHISPRFEQRSSSESESLSSRKCDSVEKELSDGDTMSVSGI